MGLCTKKYIHLDYWLWLVNFQVAHKFKVFLDFNYPSRTVICNFLVLACFRRFDPRRECNLRKYSYLLPAGIIGIQSHFSQDEIDFHISEFNSILNVFEVYSFSFVFGLVVVAELFICLNIIYKFSLLPINLS